MLNTYGYGRKPYFVEFDGDTQVHTHKQLFAEQVTKEDKGIETC
jgi:hypothetical protein